jgi:hypothetical protein
VVPGLPLCRPNAKGRRRERAESAGAAAPEPGSSCIPHDGSAEDLRGCNPAIPVEAMESAIGVWHVMCSRLRGMKDLLYVGLTVAFFAIAWLYAKSFDRI